VSFEQIKREVAMLDEQQQVDLISYTLQLRYGTIPAITAKSPTGSTTPTNPTG